MTAFEDEQRRQREQLAADKAETDAQRRASEVVTLLRQLPRNAALGSLRALATYAGGEKGDAFARALTEKALAALAKVGA